MFLSTLPVASRASDLRFLLLPSPPAVVLLLCGRWCSVFTFVGLCLRQDLSSQQQQQQQQWITSTELLQRLNPLETTCLGWH